MPSPTLVWHRVVWKNLSGRYGHSTGTGNKIFQSEEITKSFVDHISYWLETPNENDFKNTLKEYRYRNAFWEIPCGDLLLKILVEDQTEFFTITAYLSFADNFNQKQIKDKLAMELYCSFKTVSTELRTHQDIIGKETENWKVPSATHARLKLNRESEINRIKEKFFNPPNKPYTFLYEEIWKELKIPNISQELDCIIDYTLEKINLTSKEPKTKGIISDFRGVMVTYNKYGDDFFLLPNNTRVNSRKDKQEYFEENEAFELANAMIPFVAAEDKKREVEHSFTRFSGGRAIYATSLAGENSTDQDHKPLKYFLLTKDDNPRQNARFIHAINDMGTYRIAALYDIDNIREVSSNLRIAEESLEQIDWGLDEWNGEDGGITKLKDEWATKDKTEAIKTSSLESTHQLLSLLAIENKAKGNSGLQDNEAENDKPKRVITGGIGHRVERSRHYAKEFHRIIKFLRIEDKGRIEGFAPYDIFVERRLGDAFDYVDMVGVRHKRVMDKIHGVESRIRTMQAISLRKGAEMAFWTVLFPYYFLNVMTEYVLGKEMVEKGNLWDDINYIAGIKMEQSTIEQILHSAGNYGFLLFTIAIFFGFSNAYKISK